MPPNKAKLNAKARKKALGDLDLGLPEGRDLTPDELELGTPRLQTFMRLVARGDTQGALKFFDKLNILQANQLVSYIRGLQQQAEAKEKIPANVMDFMLAEGNGIYKETKHTRLMGDYVARAEKPDTPHLWISLPPGHGKSTSVGFWNLVRYMARFPQRHNALIMHKYDSAEKRTKRIRNWIRAYGSKFGLHLDETSKGAGSFKLRQGGSLTAYGTSTGITGDRFNGIVLLDDPVKGQEMVRSADQRDNQWDWFLAEILNRLDPGGKIIGIMTRWHEDDICGRCVTRSEEVEAAVESQRIKFDYLVLPAIANDEDDPLGRKPGEALWPERIPLANLMAIRATYTPYMWSSLYQGTPTPDEGITFNKEWWQFYERPPEKFDLLIQSWDLAFGDLETSDYTVGILMGRRGPHVYVLNVERKRLDFPNAVEKIREWSLRYPTASGKLVERAANGWAAIAMLAKEIPGIMPIPATESKEIRAQAVLPFVMAKNVWLPKVAPWLDAFLKELAQFGGGGKYDDQVDAFTQGLNFLMHGAYQSKDAMKRAAQEAAPPKTTAEIYGRQFSSFFQRVVEQHAAAINGKSLSGDGRWNYPSDRIPTPGGEIV